MHRKKASTCSCGGQNDYPQPVWKEHQAKDEERGPQSDPVGGVEYSFVADSSEEQEVVDEDRSKEAGEKVLVD